MNVVAPAEFQLNGASFCTGGGGLDQGLELAIPGLRPVVYVEGEAYAVAVLVEAIRQGLLVDAPIWSDATTFRGRPWRGVLDFFFGGIPCQPHSLAGNRDGEDDERDLWSDARRVIAQSQPWGVLIENVQGMLTAKPGLDPGAKRVWRDLRRMGYEVEGGLFAASEVVVDEAGAAHERLRIFILGIRTDLLADAIRRRGMADAAGGPGGLHEGPRRGGPGASEPGRSGLDVAHASGQGSQGLGPGAGGQGQRPAAERGGGPVEHASSLGRGEGRPEPELHGRGRNAPAGSIGEVAHATDLGRGPGIERDVGAGPESRPALATASDREVADAAGGGAGSGFRLHGFCADHGICHEPNLCDGNTNCFLTRFPDQCPAEWDDESGEWIELADPEGRRWHERLRLREGGSEHDRRQSSDFSRDVADPASLGLEGPGQPGTPAGDGRSAGDLGPEVADTIGGHDGGRPVLTLGGPAGRTAVALAGEGPLLAPGPSDYGAWSRLLAQWPQLEPAVCRTPDVVAPWLDAALVDRIDRLRLLGNGVMPIQAALAIRVLATRMSRRSAGAAFLVQLMKLDEQP